MSEPQWYWTEGGQPAGPGPLGELARRVADGRVGPDEQAWAEGMGDWAAVRDVPALAHCRPAAALRDAVGQASDPLGYFSTPPTLPPRAADALRGHAPPIGDAADWPLDDDRFAQLTEAARVRRPITAAVDLFRALFAVAAVTTLALLVSLIVTLAGTGPRDREMVLGLGLLAAVGAAAAALFHVAARSAQRSRRAGPIALLVMFLSFAAVELLAVSVGIVRGRGPGMVTGNLLGLAVAAALCAIAGRAVAAAPRYRRHPAWCQELIARVERPC